MKKQSKKREPIYAIVDLETTGTSVKHGDRIIQIGCVLVQAGQIINQFETKNMSQLEMISIEEFVPKDHLLRKISKAVDFDRIYDFVGDLYCLDNGRPGVDPVVLFKMVLIQHLYGIPSLRKSAEEVRANIYYRWFCGYLLNEQIPHFSTLSRNFKHRFNEEVVEEIFFWILSEIDGSRYLSPEAVFIDGTHIKANANMKKAVKKAVPEAANVYEEQLMNEIDYSALRKTLIRCKENGNSPKERTSCII